MPIFKSLSIDEIERRSIYMRLYRARWEGVVSYPSHLVNGQAPALLAQGHIERVGDGYRLTEDGVHAWAEIVAPLLPDTCNGRDGQSPLMNELRLILGKPIRRNGHMKAIHWRVLKRLAKSGGSLPVADIPESNISTLAATNAVIELNGCYHITRVGEYMLNQHLEEEC